MRGSSFSMISLITFGIYLNIYTFWIHCSSFLPMRLYPFSLGGSGSNLLLDYECPTWLYWRQWILKRSLVKQIKRDASATNPSLLSASEAFPPTWGHRVLPPPPPISEHKQRCTDHYLQKSKHHKKHDYKQANESPNISIHRQQRCTLHRHWCAALLPALQAKYDQNLAKDKALSNPWVVCAENASHSSGQDWTAPQ